MFPVSRLATTALATLCLSTLTAQIYVKAGATGNGSSWSSPLGSLDTAISMIPLGGLIYLAEGNYKPTVWRVPTDPRSVSFSLVPFTTIRGGWKGLPGETTPTGQARLTILDGDVGTAGNATDNAYHVVHIQPISINGDYLLDSVTITRGNANGSASTDDDAGGGLYSNGWQASITVVLNRVIAAGNFGVRGGGLYFSDHTFAVLRSTIDANRGTHGAGMYVGGGDFGDVINCVFRNNAATQNGGGSWLVSTLSGAGPINPDGSIGTVQTMNFINTVFVGNSAARGGAIFASAPFVPYSGGGASLMQCTLTQNNATLGGLALFAEVGSNGFLVRNSIVWGNGSVQTFGAIDGLYYAGYSRLQGPIPIGPGNPQNSAGNPLFVSSSNLQLQSTSTCIDRGANPALPSDSWDMNLNGNFSELLPIDLAGVARIRGPLLRVDIGAYEF